MQITRFGKYGKLAISDELDDGEGMRIGRDFFTNLCRLTFTNMARYYEAMKEEHIFAYRERQAATYLMPALFELTSGATMCEVPINRQKGGKASESTPEDESTNGFLDYWAHYRNQAIAIEAKHAFYSLQGKGTTTIKKKWQEAMKQMETNGPRIQDITDGKGYLQLALLILVFWSSGENDVINLESISEETDPAFDTFHPQLAQFWLLPKAWQKIHYREEKRSEFYPAVGMFGRLSFIKV